ncbi:hypothetical protein [Salipiger aestuarii]|uniref:hypothetical protein n=1 Tax=Salipiger aestuarii TaxID=568098 RepID=UPI0016819803|nr:hypothetical protein [Salipiger aestuarii]
MVFHDPFGALDPRRSIGAQIADALVTHSIAPRATSATRRWCCAGPTVRPGPMCR